MFREAARGARGGARAAGRATASAWPRSASGCAPSAPRAVVTCARGSSDHAATFAKYLMETRLGVLTVLGGALGHLGLRRAPGPVATASSSRSRNRAAAPTSLVTARAAREAGACRGRDGQRRKARRSPSSPTTRSPSCAGEERSVAATKSYIASLAAVAHLVAEWSARRRSCARRSRAARTAGAWPGSSTGSPAARAPPAGARTSS